MVVQIQKNLSEELFRELETHGRVIFWEYPVERLGNEGIITIKRD